MSAPLFESGAHGDFHFRKQREVFYAFGVTQIFTMAAVGLGGALGAILRWVVSVIVSSSSLAPRFPLATFVVNIIGCLLIGFYGAIDVRAASSSFQRAFFVTGILGGFTTFSAFGLETATLARGGHLFEAFLYALSSVVLGVCGVCVGLWLGARS